MSRTLPAVLCGLALGGALASSRLYAAAAPVAVRSTPPLPDLNELKRLSTRLVPTELKVDVSALAAGDRAALVQLIQAARIVDLIFMDQYWGGDRSLYQELRRSPKPLGHAQADYFFINKGPWSALDDHRAFVGSVPERKPLGANFYPAGMSREELTRWMQTLPEPKRQAASGFFSVIRRDAQGQLQVVPYSVAYKPELTRCAELLQKAAALTTNASLRKFLQQRAAAFASDDYYPSDVA